jgi:hypothetical protein
MNDPKQPTDSNADRANADEEFTEADFAEMVAGKRRELDERLGRLGVFRDLSPDQRERLTDIVMQLSGAHGLWREYPELKKRIRVDQRLGDAQRRMFRGKVKNAIAAVDDALNYVSRVSSGTPPNEFFAQTLRNFAAPYLHQAKKALQTIPLEWRNFTRPASGSGFENSKAEAREALMTFFIDTCGLTKSKASQRTARIGNSLFGWNVDESDRHESANPARSRAVIKSYNRKTSKRR